MHIYLNIAGLSCIPNDPLLVNLKSPHQNCVSKPPLKPNLNIFI